MAPQPKEHSRPRYASISSKDQISIKNDDEFENTDSVREIKNFEDEDIAVKSVNDDDSFKSEESGDETPG